MISAVAKETWASVARRVAASLVDYDHPESLGPATFYHEGRLDDPFDPRSHECARTKPKPCGSARPARRQDRAALSQDRGGALFYSRRRGRDRARRRTSPGRPGRCHPHPAGRVAHDHGYRAGALSLLLRAALFGRGYVFQVTGRWFRATESEKREVKSAENGD
jgi:hypothetical protein